MHAINLLDFQTDGGVGDKKYSSTVEWNLAYLSITFSHGDEDMKLEFGEVEGYMFSLRA